MKVTVHLLMGPLDGVEVQIECDTLDDIPQDIPMQGGAYVRYQQFGADMHTDRGALVFRWDDGTMRE